MYKINIFTYEGENGNVVSQGRRYRSNKFVVPGPGAYDINLHSVKNNSPRFSFGIKVV